MLLTSGGGGAGGGPLQGALGGGQTWLWRESSPTESARGGGGCPPPPGPAHRDVQFLEGEELVVHLHRPQQPVCLLHELQGPCGERQAGLGTPSLRRSLGTRSPTLHGPQLTWGTHHQGCRGQRDQRHHCRGCGLGGEGFGGVVGGRTRRRRGEIRAGTEGGGAG